MMIHDFVFQTIVSLTNIKTFVPTVSFRYSNSDSQEVSMNINRSGIKKGGTFKSNSTTEITPNQMR